MSEAVSVRRSIKSLNTQVALVLHEGVPNKGTQFTTYKHTRNKGPIHCVTWYECLIRVLPRTMERSGQVVRRNM